ncbi:HAMP domain-containing protein [Rubrivivax sp. JA1055]|nr:ATP-binding protein [Rubrivivax sp. JA1029]MCC9596135.1 HAMP domain-containing protein [Rubrivivax sp. JA1055]MCC9647523.1 HAMP domain-containing protein [Rubrivivax sp. JA1029]
MPSLQSWLRHLDSLRVKLFLAIAGANVVLVMAASLVYSWSFERGFVEYLQHSEEARLTPVVARLADGYREHGDWRWLTDDEDRWFRLLHEMLGVTRSRRFGPEAPAIAPPGAAPLPPVTIDPRILLLDASRERLLGPPNRQDQAVLRPIEVGGRTVGFLGYVPRLSMVASLEQVFQQQQNRKFGFIAVGMLLAVLLTAAWISRWLTLRLRALGESAAAVSHGDYTVRIGVRGHDELAELARDFNRMAASLDAAKSARERWIADIAHELRTPLTTLRVEIEALVDGVRRPSADTLASLAQEVLRLSRLVEDLRLLSLADLGALSMRLQHLDLAGLVREYLKDQRAQLPADATLQQALEPGGVIHADPDRMAQVFGNLMQNSLRYTHAPMQLRVAVRVEGEEVVLTWEDSAPGVPEDALPRLTERLFRVEDSRSRAGGGSGLGLAIVHAIVTGHGGTMLADASPLGGLRWTLRFARLDEPADD